ncbi:ABC transporter permease, partial [Vibrio sp.]|nr:ABC transporter permease [Vibrio sp.]
MKLLFQLIFRNKMALTGLTIVSLFLLMAIFAPLLSKHAPDKRTGNPHEYPGFVVTLANADKDGWVAQNLATDRRSMLLSKKADHVLGTTRVGRDVWSQLVHGARVSLAVGFGAGITVCFLATVIGISAGYFGGRVDDVLTAAMNIMLVMPQYPLLFVVAAFIG